MLARRKVIDANRLGDIRGGNAYLNVVSDIGTLARVLRDRQARRVAVFFKWEQHDERTFLPSLWKGRGRRPADPEPEVLEEPVVDPSGEAPTDGEPKEPTKPHDPGLPGGSPFL